MAPIQHLKMVEIRIPWSLMLIQGFTWVDPSIIYQVPMASFLEVGVGVMTLQEAPVLQWKLFFIIKFFKSGNAIFINYTIEIRVV